jgi:hypothetical protein
MDDEDNRKLTPGFYNAQVKYALDELGFDISFLPVTNDYEMPVDLILEMPSGCFNLREIHAYVGTPDAVEYTENIYWHKGMRTRGAETGQTSNVRGWNTSDPFFRVPLTETSLYYFNVQNGLIYLSDACLIFDYVRLTYDGIPSKNLDAVKMIPPECRKAIVLWVTDKCAASLKLRDNKYRAVQVDAVAQLDEYGFNGAWHEAQMRLARLDRKKFKDSILYNSNLLTH